MIADDAVILSRGLFDDLVAQHFADVATHGGYDVTVIDGRVYTAIGQVAA